MSALNTILNHQSVRNFTGQLLSDDKVEMLSKVVSQTSTSCYFQLVRVIRITDREKLARIASLSGNQSHIANCAEFWMFCIDVRLLMHEIGLKTPVPFRYFYSGMNDCSLCCQNVLTAAEEMGLGGTIIGGFKPGIKEISSMLNLQVGVAPCLGLILGVSDKTYEERQKPRLNTSYIIMENTYKDMYDEDLISAYNKEVKDYYENRKYNKCSKNWTQACKEMAGDSKVLEVNPLIEYFKEQGFAFS